MLVGPILCCAIVTYATSLDGTQTSQCFGAGSGPLEFRTTSASDSPQTDGTHGCLRHSAIRVETCVIDVTVFESISRITMPLPARLSG